jgi:hypothetical protein
LNVTAVKEWIGQRRFLTWFGMTVSRFGCSITQTRVKFQLEQKF